MREISILVADDDANICQLIELYLAKEGYTVRKAARGDDALASFRRNPPDLVLLDIMMPGVDGVEVLKTIRRTSQIPVIMLTAREDTFDKVLALELGADDYITKPFDGKEMVARVKAVLRRTHAQEDVEDTLNFPGLSVSLREYECRYEGQKIEMPAKELEVLYFLASHPGQVFTREQLLEQVWGFDFAGDSSRTVDVHVKRIREKLPGSEQHGWSIHTVWGVGYKFEVA